MSRAPTDADEQQAAMPDLVRGTVVTPEDVIDDGIIEIAGDRISGVTSYDDWTTRHPDRPVPEPSGLLLPGLVDIHCHGGGGFGFPTTDTDAARAAARHHHRHGSTSVVASLVTAQADVLLAQLAALAPLAHDGTVAGIHLEGPFLSTARCGAQDPDLIVEPDTDLAQQLVDTADETLTMMTVAPERPNAAALTALLREHGVTVALGHSDATFEKFADAITALDGTAVVTHLANGMPPFHHRAAGPVGAALVAASRCEAIVELIADGQHTDAGFVRLAFTTGADRIALVTDAMAAAGMPDGEYDLGSRRVGVREGVARLLGPGGTYGSIAGGTSHLIEDVARCVHAYGIGLVDAVRAASTTPAAAIGAADRIGALLPGRYADVVVTDERLQPLRVLRRGAWME